MVNKRPSVSVLMPVYNEENWLSNSIETVLNQDFKDIEFIIVNDGSTDETKTILENYKRKDERIKVYDKENSGIVDSLNHGLKKARGNFIARIDADNLCDSSRLRKQYEYLKQNRDISLVASWRIDRFPEKFRYCKYPISDYYIKKALVRSCVISHSSVMVRSSVLKKYIYRKIESEDYDLWIRMIRDGHKFHILDEYLCEAYNRDDSLTKKRGKIKTLRDLTKIHYNAYRFSPYSSWYEIIFVLKPLCQLIIPDRVINFYIDKKMSK